MTLALDFKVYFLSCLHNNATFIYLKTSKGKFEHLLLFYE